MPAAWVYQTTASVPSKSSEVLKQSVPFAIEEELSNDIEDNHFAFLAIAESEQKVSVIAKGHLARIKQAVQKSQLHVVGLVSEVDFCPKATDTATVWLHDGDALICLAEKETLQVSKAQVAELLPVFAADLTYIQCNEAIDESWLSSGLKEKAKLSINQCFDALNVNDVVNIMPTDWLKSTDEQAPKSLKRVATLFAMLLVSWVGIKSYQHISVSQEIKASKQQQITLFTKRFGDASGSELADLAGGVGDAGEGGEGGVAVVEVVTESDDGEVLGNGDSLTGGGATGQQSAASDQAAAVRDGGAGAANGVESAATK